MALNIILMGAPGVGKGTQAAALAKALGIPHISTGDMFREILKQSSPLANKIKEVIQSGCLVSDDLTNELVSDRLAQKDTLSGFILDGYPRNIFQAEYLTKVLKSNKRELNFAINLEANKDIVLMRLGGRRVCPKCGATYHILLNKPQVEGMCDKCESSLITRKDDTSEVISNRLRIYEETAKPLLDYYNASGKLVTIDASDEQSIVLNRIAQRVKNL